MPGIVVEIARPGSWCGRMGSVPQSGGCGTSARYSALARPYLSAGDRGVGQQIFVPQASGACDAGVAGQRLSLGAKEASDRPPREWGRLARIAVSRRGGARCRNDQRRAWPIALV
ncbi:hypothetical protein MRX96_002951 [Rhipicephalus microplus]